MPLTSLKLGFIRLTDSAPLIVAREKGFYAEEGLDVTLLRQNSWSLIRDKVASGELDGAHMLGPLVASSWLEDSNASSPFTTALALNLNGAGLTVSSDLYQEMKLLSPAAMTNRPVSADALKAVMAQRIEDNRPPLTFGAVFPFSVHAYAIRFWLSAQAIDPDRDLRIVTAHPEVMVQQLESGMIDAFCVGEPWNSLAEIRGSGWTIARANDIWQHMPDKVLGVRANWADANPDLHLQLIRGTLKACAWLDHAKNRAEAVHILSDPKYLGVNPGALSVALTGSPALTHRQSVMQLPESLIFHHNMANFPWHSHALWFLSQMVRWGQVSKPVSLKTLAEKAYRPDIYRQAARALGLPIPTINSKPEGSQDRPWLLETEDGFVPMGASQFLDRSSYNPDKLQQYLEGFLRHNSRIDFSEV